MFGVFTGVLANAALVIVGGLIGSLFKSEKLKKIGESVFRIFAIFVMVLGIIGAAESEHPIFILLSLVIGVAIGELLNIDGFFRRMGDYAQAKMRGKGGSNFSEGLVSATLLFCIGSMTFMGALESGLKNQHTIYFTKGMLDGVSALTLAMGSGIGVAFSAFPLIVYQGLLVLLASLLQDVLTGAVVSICSSIGSLFLVGIALNMLGITRLKVANYLPAMFMPILYQLITALFNLQSILK
jgi:uncharacterized membrane protein YqgA involved in biofilm formation